MVDRVGNGPGYNYPQVNERKVNSGATGAGEKFQLDYGKEGAIYEPSSETLKKQQEDKKAATRTSDTSKTEDEGVRLTLSGTATNRLEEAKQSDATQAGGILDLVTGVVNKIIDAIKGFFSSIWNDPPSTESTDISSGFDGTVPKADVANEVELVNENTAIKPKTKFEQAKAEAEAFLASSEGKKVARNSDLLTYYDKHGIVVNMSPSDKQRILYGDKNQIEI